MYLCKTKQAHHRYRVINFAFKVENNFLYVFSFINLKQSLAYYVVVVFYEVKIVFTISVVRKNVTEFVTDIEVTQNCLKVIWMTKPRVAN